MDQQLQVFVTVVEQRSFSRAAELLHLTQPAVSLQVRGLERELGAPLLERSNKFMGLTRAGEIVYEYARHIVEAQGQMRRAVDDLMQVTSGPLTIGASYTIGEYVLPHALAPFHRAYPLVNPEVSIGNTSRVAELVAERRLDVGLVEGDVEGARLTVEALLTDDLVIVAAEGHPLAGQMGLRAEAVATETWLAREVGSGTRAVTERFFAEQGLAPSQVFTLGSTQMIKEAAEAGLGIALLSRWAIRKEIAMGTLTVLDVEGTPCARQFWAITPRTRFRTKTLDVFLAFLAGTLPRLDAQMRGGAGEMSV